MMMMTMMMVMLLVVMMAEPALMLLMQRTVTETKRAQWRSKQTAGRKNHPVLPV